MTDEGCCCGRRVCVLSADPTTTTPHPPPRRHPPMPDNRAYWKRVAEHLDAKSRAAAAEAESAGAAPRVVATLTAPIDVGHLCTLAEQIEATYGAPLRMRQTGQVLEFIRPTTTEAP